MKKVLCILSLLFVLFVSFPVIAQEIPSQDECQLMLNAAKDNHRFVLFESGILFPILNNGECDYDAKGSPVCIVKEEISPCGQVKQYVAYNENKVVNSIFTFEPIIIYNQDGTESKVVFILSDLQKAEGFSI